MVNATPWPLYPRERDAVHITQEDGWALGPVWTGAEILVPTGILSPDRPARSESLHRLRYPGPTLMSFWIEIRHPIHQCSPIYCSRPSEKACRLDRNRLVSIRVIPVPVFDEKIFQCWQSTEA
jgi:hypothetical protein